MTSTDIGTPSKRLYAKATTMASRPMKLALKMLSRSATLAKRQRPRYRPTRQNTTAWMTSTSEVSMFQSGNAGASASIE